MLACVLLLGRVALVAQRPIVIKLRSRDDADSGIWGSVHRKGYFWGANLGRAIVTNEDFTAYTCVTAPPRGPLPKLLWADLLFFIAPTDSKETQYTQPIQLYTENTKEKIMST